MTGEQSKYLVKPIFEDGKLTDLELVWPERSWRMLGRGGAKRELDLSAPGAKDALPVLIGSGLGLLLEKLLEQSGAEGRIAVIDREEPIYAQSRARERFGRDQRVLWLDSDDIDQTMNALTVWQTGNNFRPFQVIANPLYLRIDPFYAELHGRLNAAARVNFWQQARYAKFTGKLPRILLITSSYFLMGEMIAACRRLNVPHRFLSIADEEVGRVEFVEQLLTEVLDFKPDFVFTINHLGVDREGALAELLEKLQLPLASWFVDNPHLILYLYEHLNSPWTAIYTWDADNLESLEKRGFPHVRYLPLGTDVQRFHPGAKARHKAARPFEVAFVGNSMHYKVLRKLTRNVFPRELLEAYPKIAERFRAHGERSVQALMATDFPELLPAFERLGSIELKLEYEVLVTHEATRLYRSDCVSRTLPFHPLIAGDDGWKIIFGDCRRQWSYRPEMSYYDELPGFYPLNEINFNCTSTQMKGAVNQRVFDVPATGSFILTDWRVQMENLFEPGKEVACFRHPDEIADLIRHYLKHPAERRNIAEAARRRILAEHTYDHRLLALIKSMREIYG